MKFKFLKQSKYKKGDRVVLPEDPEAQLGQEVGTVVEVENQKQFPGMYLVQLEDEFLFDIDDGLREIHIDDISGLYVRGAREVAKTLQLMGFPVKSSHEANAVLSPGRIYLPGDIAVFTRFNGEFQAFRYTGSGSYVSRIDSRLVKNYLDLAAEINRIIERSKP